MFIRLWKIRCRQFGEHLHRYQVTHGEALPSHKRLRDTLEYPPWNHTWVIVWGKVRQHISVTMTVTHNRPGQARPGDIPIRPRNIGESKGKR